MAFDSQAGKQPGLEIWRIEQLNPVRVDKKDFGRFYTGDCYLVLKTTETKGSITQDLHFWLGANSSQDEQGAAAYRTVELDDQLGGAPVQHREVQGHESAKFLSYFPNLQYQDGGVDSAFRHVEPDKYEPRLFHCKGKRNVRVQQVGLNRSSLNSGDVFILDLGLKLYQWNGSQANKYEKFKALEFITKLNDEERGHRAELIVLDEKVNDSEAKEFWTALGGYGPVASADAGGSDDDTKTSETVLIRVSDASGTLEYKEVARGKLEREMLDPNDVFIIDTGSEVFCWIGKGATPAERKKGMEFASQYLKDQGRPAWTPLTRVPGGGETPALKSHFVQWDKPKFVDISGGGAAVQQVQEAIDVSALHQAVRAAEDSMADDGSGKITAWRIEDYAKVEVDSKLVGQFFSGDSYIILYEYIKSGKPNWIIYFWQGRDSSIDEKGSSALLAKQLDDELGGDPVQVRVVQNKEPNHFLTLFKGRMIVHKGGRASGFSNVNDVDSYNTSGTALYHVRGTNSLNTRAVEVDANAASLNSGDCFVLKTPSTVYVWQGMGANADERTVATNIAGILAGSIPVQNIDENSEPDSFWEALGGKADYPRTKELQESVREPRLFHCSNITGRFRAEEIYDFVQDDLLNDDVFILDCYSEVFVWIGHEARQEEKDKALQLALDYVTSASSHDGRDASTPVYKVLAGGEPPNFTCHFRGWNNVSAHQDLYKEYLAKSGVHVGAPSSSSSSSSSAAADTKAPAPHVEVVTAASIGFHKGTFDLATLQSRSWPANLNVDRANLENYLTDSDFQTLFGMGRAEFAALKEWKKKDLKQKQKLF